jgi:hypothetical protein
MQEGGPLYLPLRHTANLSSLPHTIDFRFLLAPTAEALAANRSQRSGHVALVLDPANLTARLGYCNLPAIKPTTSQRTSATAAASAHRPNTNQPPPDYDADYEDYDPQVWDNAQPPPTARQHCAQHCRPSSRQSPTVRKCCQPSSHHPPTTQTTHAHQQQPTPW